MTRCRKRVAPIRGWRSWRDDHGVAAVEFALILPVALLILGLVVYGGQTFGVQRKVTLSAMTVANLFSQGNNTAAATITTAELNQILAYPNLILYPNDPTGVQVVVSQLSVTVTCSSGTVTSATGKVVGSWANSSGTPLKNGQTMSVDADVANAFYNACNNSPSGYVILGQVSYPFQPYGVSYALPQVTLHDSIMMVPRTANCIAVQPDNPGTCS